MVEFESLNIIGMKHILLFNKFLQLLVSLLVKLHDSLLERRDFITQTIALLVKIELLVLILFDKRGDFVVLEVVQVLKLVDFALQHSLLILVVILEVIHLVVLLPVEHRALRLQVPLVLEVELSDSVSKLLAVLVQPDSLKLAFVLVVLDFCLQLYNHLLAVLKNFSHLPHLLLVQ